MPTSIYDQHDKAFANVSAYAILRDGKPVAKIAFKFPRDGAGRLYAYVHWLGTEMTRGHANGYGYDKRSAAASVAARKMRKSPGYEVATREYRVTNFSTFVYELEKDDGHTWDSRLRDAGFDVFQAV